MQHLFRCHAITFLFAAHVSGMVSGQAATNQNPDHSSGLFISLPIIVSLAALALSLFSLVFTAYNQYGKGPRFTIFLGQRIELFAALEQRFGITARLVIFNNGAKYGALRDISGTIGRAGEASTVSLHWRMFVEGKNVGKEGETFQAHDTFAGWADSLVIPSRQAVDRRIQFGTVSAFTPGSGDYELIFFGFDFSRKKPVCQTRIRFELKTEDILTLKETAVDPDTRVRKKSLPVKVTSQKSGFHQN